MKQKAILMLMACNKVVSTLEIEISKVPDDARWYATNDYTWQYTHKGAAPITITKCVGSPPQEVVAIGIPAESVYDMPCSKLPCVLKPNDVLTIYIQTGAEIVRVG